MLDEAIEYLKSLQLQVQVYIDKILLRISFLFSVRFPRVIKPSTWIMRCVKASLNKNCPYTNWRLVDCLEET